MAGAKVGDRAPNFELRGTGDSLYRLADYRGRNLILAFYPGDFTAVCTRQFCSYRDGAERIAGLGAEMLGISPQSVESHERFRDEYGLNLPLLADPDRSVARAYGVVSGPLVRRAIFLIDGEGVIRFRKVALVGLSYVDIDGLESIVARHGG